MVHVGASRDENRVSNTCVISGAGFRQCGGLLFGKTLEQALSFGYLPLLQLTDISHN